jgi:hypothetical protein
VSAVNDPNAVSRSFVDRAHWRTDVLTLVVTAAGFVATSAVLSALTCLPGWAGAVLAAVGWVGWWASDVAQAWIWRRGRR